MQDVIAPVDGARSDNSVEIKSALDSLLEIVCQLDEWIARVDDAQLRRSYASMLARLNHLRYGGGNE